MLYCLLSLLREEILRWPCNWWVSCMSPTDDAHEEFSVFHSLSFLLPLLFFSSQVCLLFFATSSSSCLSFRFLPLFLMLFYYILFVLVLLLLDSLASSVFLSCFFLFFSFLFSSLHLCSAVRDEDGNRTKSEIDQNSISSPWLTFLSLSFSVFPWQPLPVMYSKNGGDTSCIPRSLLFLLPLTSFLSMSRKPFTLLPPVFLYPLFVSLSLLKTFFSSLCVHFHPQAIASFTFL